MVGILDVKLLNRTKKKQDPFCLKIFVLLYILLDWRALGCQFKYYAFCHILDV